MKVGKLARFIVILFFVTTCARGAAPVPVNYSDQWWNPQESGWGLFLAQHNDAMFGVLYVYDLDGTPMWLTLQGGTFTDNYRTFTASLYRTTGPRADQPPFDPSRVQISKVGSAVLRFTDNNNAAFQYDINGVAVQKTVARQIFGNWPAEYPFDATDLWWNSNENGWGVSIAQQGTKAFTVLFVYDPSGRPIWYVGSDASELYNGFSFVAKSFSWKTYLTRGTPYSQPWRSADFSITEWGSFQFSMGLNTSTTSSMTGLVDNRVSAFWGAKPMQRMSFGSPATYPNKVILTSPAPGAANVVIGSDGLSAQYGRPLAQPISAGSSKGFFLFDGATAVPGTAFYQRSSFTVDDVYRTIKFSPSVQLQPNTTYRAVVSGQVGLDGMPIQDFEWRFTTAPAHTFDGSPFVLFGGPAWKAAVEGSNGANPVIRAVTDPLYAYGFASRTILSDASMKGPGGIWFTSAIGVTTSSGGSLQHQYRFGILDPTSMQIKQTAAEISYSPATHFMAMACSPNGSRCYMARYSNDSNGNFVRSDVDVVNTATQQVERTITRLAADPFPWVETLIADDTAVYVMYERITGNEDEATLVKIEPLTGSETSSAVISPAYFVPGMAISPASQRLWLAGTPKVFGSAQPQTWAIDTGTLRIVAQQSQRVLGAGSGMVAVPGADRILIVDFSTDTDSPMIRLVDGESLTQVANLSAAGMFPSSSFGINAICMESNGRTGWALLNSSFNGSAVYQVNISGTTISWGPPIPFAAGFDFGSTGPSVEKIRCLQ